MHMCNLLETADLIVFATTHINNPPPTYIPQHYPKDIFYNKVLTTSLKVYNSSNPNPEEESGRGVLLLLMVVMASFDFCVL